ncbi:hypothetical protein HBI47_171520 [Parastagonospora nodorum]|nr:hypothetical protein HBI47_171520 [Parastagonospora nodorum]
MPKKTAATSAVLKPKLLATLYIDLDRLALPQYVSDALYVVMCRLLPCGCLYTLSNPPKLDWSSTCRPCFAVCIQRKTRCGGVQPRKHSENSHLQRGGGPRDAKA